MKSTSWFLVAAALAVALVGSPSGVAAQSGCGDNCLGCGWELYEPTDPPATLPGKWENGCSDAQHCSFCSESPLVKTGPAKQERILTSIKTATSAQVRNLVNANRSTLLIHASRNLVVIRGNNCDVNAITAVMSVDPARIKLLQSMGVRSLEEFLDSTGNR